MKRDNLIFITMASVVLLILLFVIFGGLNLFEKNYDREFCYFYADEKVGDKSWVQHDYYLLKEMQKEAQEYYNVSYDFNPSPKKIIFVLGDGRSTSYSFNPETKEPIVATCSFDGFIQEGNIRHKFEVIKEINISDLKSWREQWD